MGIIDDILSGKFDEGTSSEGFINTSDMRKPVPKPKKSSPNPDEDEPKVDEGPDEDDEEVDMQVSPSKRSRSNTEERDRKALALNSDEEEDSLTFGFHDELDQDLDLAPEDVPTYMDEVDDDDEAEEEVDEDLEDDVADSDVPSEEWEAEYVKEQETDNELEAAASQYIEKPKQSKVREIKKTTNSTSDNKPKQSTQASDSSMKQRGAPYKLAQHAEEVVRLYNEGVSAKTLAEKFQVSTSCVISTIKRANITIRPKGRKPSGK